MSKVIEVDCSTGISTERDMTEAELAAQAAMQAQAEEARAAEEADKAAKEIAKAELLVKLGITADEAKLLLS